MSASEEEARVMPRWGRWIAWCGVVGVTLDVVSTVALPRLVAPGAWRDQIYFALQLSERSALALMFGASVFAAVVGYNRKKAWPSR